MTETVATDPTVTSDDQPAHDHAWRRVSADESSPGRLGTYQCDICSTGWSM